MSAAEDLPGFRCADLLALPLSLHRGVERAAVARLRAEVSATRLRRRDPFSLPLTDERALGFGDVT